MPLSAEDLASRCEGITLLVMDVDGVLTDGVIAVDDRGVETKHFYVRDGSALALWRKAGHRAAILSGRSAQVVAIRAAELKISPVVQGRPEKLEPFREMVGDLGLRPDQVCYVGDDTLDLPVLRAAGLSACPADAVPEVRASVDFVAPSAGGRGAIRDVVEMLLKGQGLWEGLVASSLQPADEPGRRS